MDSIDSLVGFLKKLEYEDIPKETLEIVKLDILDYFGNSLGGSSDKAIAAAFELAAQWGGAPQCSVIAHDVRLPAPMAGMLNAAMGFVLDFDDTHERSVTHIGVACIPAALAAAQLRGGVSGKEFITAVTGGLEVIARLGIAASKRKPEHIMGGWDYAQLHGIFSATAAAGKILGLTEREYLNAFGLAYNQAAGNTLSALEEADSKLLGPGFAVRDALTCVLMAQKGITGAVSVLDGSPYSMATMYHTGFDAASISRRLGEVFELTDMSFKAYPCCRLGHRQIEALLALVKKEDIRPREVKSISVQVCSTVNIQLCTPLQEKYRPGNRMAAQFSLPWMLACVVTKRRVGVRDITGVALLDEETAQISEKVSVEYREELPNHKAPARIVVSTSRGDFETYTSAAKGDPEQPMTKEDFAAKFMDNASMACKPISQATLQRAVEQLLGIQELENVESIIALLS